MSTKSNRPIAIILESILVFVFTAWNGLRLGETIFFEKTLVDYHARPGPFYIAVTGGIWLLAGLALLWGLWSGKTWSQSITFVAALSYALWYWLDRLIFQSQDINWIFSLVTTFVLLALVGLGLNSHNSARYFRQ